MKGERHSKLFRDIRNLAASIADRCDFVVAANIKEAESSAGANHIAVCVTVRDMIERAQVICAFTYGATLNNVSLQTSADEDIKVDNGRIITMILGVE